MKDKLLSAARDKTTAISIAQRFAFWFATILYLEGLLHAVVYANVSWKILYVLGFSLSVAGLLALLTSFLPRKADLAVTAVLTLVLTVLYGSQLVYRFIFGTLYSVSQIQQGGAALTSFWKETVATIRERFVYILLLLLPLASLTALAIKGKWGAKSTNWFWRCAVALAAVVFWGVTVLCIGFGGTGYFSDYDFYHSNDVTTTQTAERFGLLTAMRLELTAAPENPAKGDDEYFSFDTATEPDSVEGSDSATPEGEAPKELGYHVLDVDFGKLNELTEDETVRAINNYCAGQVGTRKNEYTGMLRDYNLIYICAESFSTAAIDPVLTPTLYKLANSGFVFNNFYSTYPNNTTDGEYSLVMGLYPDSTRDKHANSFYASRNSYLPYTLGTIFKEQAGVEAYGYHNYEGSFYGRKETHTNMGYHMKFAKDGMKFTTNWPASDLEMMEQSVDDYIRKDRQFHAYYMTFSGHFKYERGVNPMVDRNWDCVKNETYSETARAYLACNIELDKALEYLMQRLEKAGVADKTAIVLAADHYPYGLSDGQYQELVDYEVDEFTKYRSTLIFWVGGMEEPIEVDQYCANVDVLPTILNLWGFEYDSRLLAGTDVFSNGTHVAVLADKSYFTDKVWFNASTGQVRYLVDESELPANYVENMIKYVKTKFSLSADILNTAYYNFLYEQGNVQVNRNGWISQEEWDVTFGEGIAEEDSETTIPTGTMIPTGTTVGTTDPEGTTSETTAPEDTTSETTAPEDTTSETTAPEETTSETTAPEETTSATTVPEETTAPEETTSATVAPEGTTAATTVPDETEASEATQSAENVA